MDQAKMAEIMRNNGIVGAGGAGFPSYVKLNNQADTIILNCAECEPLLKLHRQVMRDYTREIMTALTEVAEAVSVDRIIIGIKASYEEALACIKAQLSNFPKIEIGILPEVYPAGDEVVTVYETTGRIVPPGAIPIAVNCIVFNVETMFNTYNAINGSPVTHKFVTVAGEVNKPITVCVPLGITIAELIALAGGQTRDDVVYVMGGPMTGPLGTTSDVVTKTTNAVLVIPKTNFVARKKTASVRQDFIEAKSVCCNCHTCTDLCPRHNLGMPIDPARFMTASVSGRSEETAPFLNTLYCCSCGVCEMYACPQGLNPRTLIDACKGELRRNGIKSNPNAKLGTVDKGRPYKLVNKHRLTERIGLAQYDVAAPLEDVSVEFKSVKIKMSQHIGAPATPVVSVGDKVNVGDVIGTVSSDKLGVSIHASINGTVAEVTPQYVVINA